MFTKALLQKISIGVLVLGVSSLSAANTKENAEDKDLLIKQAMIKLIKDNQALEKRVLALEEQLGIDKGENNVSIKEPKPLEQNYFAFLQTAKADFAKGKKIILAQTIAKTKFLEKPNLNSKVIQELQKGQKIYLKGLVEINGAYFYKIENDIFIDAKTVSFRSK